MKIPARLLFPLLLLAAAPATAQEEASVALTFEVEAQAGAVMVALYDDAAAFDGEGRPVRVARLDVARGERVARFDGLAPGDYAAKAFHDVDGDGRMNTNPFGMPTEPYAFSNNAVGNMGPARWARARFAVAGETAQTVILK